MLICFSLSILWSKTEFLIHIWQVMLKMKSRHVAGTVTKKKKSKPLIFCFSLFSFLLMIWSRIGGGGTPSIWGLEKVVCKLCWEKIKKVTIFPFHWYLVFLLKIPIDVVLEVMKDIPAWPGRHLLEGGGDRRYFALKTVSRGVVEFECRSQREYDIWTQGVTRLLSIAADKNRPKIWC